MSKSLHQTIMFHVHAGFDVNFFTSIVILQCGKIGKLCLAASQCVCEKHQVITCPFVRSIRLLSEKTHTVPECADLLSSEGSSHTCSVGPCGHSFSGSRTNAGPSCQELSKSRQSGDAPLVPISATLFSVGTCRIFTLNAILLKRLYLLLEVNDSVCYIIFVTPAWLS